MDDPPDQSLAELLGQPFESVEYKGQRYKLRELDFGQIARFETWMIDRAEANIARLEGKFPDHYLAARMREHDRLVGAGGFAFQGPAGVAALQTIPGMTYAFYLAAQKDHPDISEVECRDVVMAEWDKLTAKVLRLLDAPKSSAPAGPSPAGATSSPGSPSSPGSKPRKKRRR